MGAKHVVGIDKETQECPIPGPWRRTHLQGHAISRQSTTGIGPKRACLNSSELFRQQDKSVEKILHNCTTDDHCNQRVCLIFPKLGTAPCRVLISKPVSARTMTWRKQKTRKGRTMLPPQITVELLSGDAPQLPSCASRVSSLPRRIIKGNLQVGGKQLGFKNVKAVHLLFARKKLANPGTDLREHLEISSRARNKPGHGSCTVYYI